MKEVDSDCFPFAILFKNSIGQWLPVEYGNLSYVDALDFAHLWIEGLNSFIGIGDNETVLGELVGRADSYIGLR